jgi:hypothetical protein
LHAIKARSINGSLTVTNVTLTQMGAPNTPVMNPAIEGDGSVALSWTPATNGPAAQGFLVLMGASPGAYISQILAGSSTNVSISGLSNGVAIYLVVIATNAVGVSLPSNELSATPVAPGQLRQLLAWDFLAAGGSAAADGSEATVAATYNTYGVQSSTLSRGAGSPAGVLYFNHGAGALNMNSANSWTGTNLAAAKAAGSYFQFTVAPNAGDQLSLSSLAYAAYQQNTHATATIVTEYSTNGFATAGVAINTNNLIQGGWSGGTNVISLAGMTALQNLTTAVTFRFWGYGFNGYEDKGLGEVTGNNDDVSLVGTVTFPPTLGFNFNGTSLSLSWPQGQLLQATKVTGPWVTNGAASPLVLTPSAPEEFFRVQVP